MTGSLIHERCETTPPHGDVIRLDVRRPPQGEPRSAVLVAHGFKGFKDWGFFPWLSERLAQDGHLVVSFNFSLNGTGPELLDFTNLDAFGRNTLSRELDDLRWMVDRMRAGDWSDGRAPESVGLLGHSRGGGTSVITAAQHQGVSALVTWAAVATFHRWSEQQVADWMSQEVTWIPNARTGQLMPLYRTLWEDLRDNRARLDVLAAATRVDVPWLVVHGSEDSTVPVAEARQLHEAGSASSLRVVDGSGHTFEAVHPPQAPTPGLIAAAEASARHFQRFLRGGR
ncbi:MAG: prolyl oligopeptidase family serine peptidase [Gemmatimonadetes bacterium]|nr:prolyl oligopeptidase family serine peptidase [Gemmatimonadota bacterium]MCY3610255.1 prolyl oligopeptidase family serine peptidase [Gemmatimonadota bacterium]